MFTNNGLKCEILAASFKNSQGAGFGLAGQALAVKMWNGDDEIDYSSEEASIITSIVEKTTAPCFIEAVNKAIEIGTNA